MECRKTLLMNPFAGQQRRHQHREQTYEHRGRGRGMKKRVGQMQRVTWEHTLPYIKLAVNGNLLPDLRNSVWGSVTS